MSSIEDIPRILKQGIRFGAIGRVCGKQIEVAADRLLNCDEVTWDVLEQIGRDLAGDHLFFCEVDIEHLQKAVERMKMVGRE